ncbi:MAG: hypothetical protein ACI4KO_10180 [Ruminiclostridium sp.]
MKISEELKKAYAESIKDSKKKEKEAIINNFRIALEIQVNAN